MDKRIRQGTLSRGGEVSFLHSLPPSGGFTLTHDRARPLDWRFTLEANGDIIAWDVPRGLPTRPADARVAQRAEDPPLDAETWDRGSFAVRRSDGDVALMLEGRRIRGRYAVREDDGIYTIERLDPEWVRPMPDHVLPMLAHAAPYPKDEDAYAFEVKWDGIRALAYVRDGRLLLRSRNLADITMQYPELARITDAVGAHDAIVDGEIVAFDERGLPSFQRLQARLGIAAPKLARARASDVPVVFVAFDLLHLDGTDTTGLPYEERRALLESLGLSNEAIQLSPSLVGQGRSLLATPGLEGVVAKRLGSAYEPGARSRAWIKIKTQRRQELVIGGWTPGKGARRGKIGALLLGVHDAPSGARFLYAGSVGTGFADVTLDRLQAKLLPYVRDESPFANAVDKKDAVFVEPRLVCEVEFTEWTRDGKLRHPSYKGLRDDKDPRHVVREDA